MAETLICVACRHPRRRHHSTLGCQADSGLCGCILTPDEIGADDDPQPTAAQRSHSEPERQPKPVALVSAAYSVAELLDKAEQSDNPRLTKQAEKVRQAVAVLDEMVTAHEKRAAAEQRIAELRAQLAEAEAELREATGGSRPTARDTAKVSSREVRQWARDNGIEVNPIGIIPARVMNAYRAAHPEAA